MTVDRFDLLQLQRFTDLADANPGIDPEVPWVALADSGIDTLAAFAHFFWPEFVEYRGSVLLNIDFDPDAYDGWLRTFEGDQVRVESVMNVIETDDLASASRYQLPDEHFRTICVELVQIMSRTWQAALDSEFPDRGLNVHIFLGDEGMNPAIWFNSSTEAGVTQPNSR